MALEVVTFRKKKDGGWQRISLPAMAERKDDGVDVTLFAVPVGADGMVRLRVQKQQERTDKPQQPADRPRGPDGFEDDDLGF